MPTDPGPEPVPERLALVGVRTRVERDTAGRVSGVRISTDGAGAGRSTSAVRYRYDAAGNRVAVDDVDGLDEGDPDGAARR